MSWMLTPSSRARRRAEGAAGIDAASALRGLCRRRRRCRRGRRLGPVHLDDFGLALLRLRRHAPVLLFALSPQPAFAFALLALCPSSMTKIVCPTLTFSPGLTLTSLTTPSADEGTSMVALSVSSSRTG